MNSTSASQAASHRKLCRSTARALQNFGLFAFLGEDELESMLMTLEYVRKQYPGGVTLYDATVEGSERLWVVLDGTVQVYDASVTPRHLMTVSRPGEMVGLTNLFLPEEQTNFTLVTFGPTDVVSLSCRALRRCREEPRYAELFVSLEKRVCRELVKLVRGKTILSRLTAAERVLHYLRHRCEVEHSRTVVVPSKESDFANYLGVHPTALSRVLRTLSREGRISYRRNVMTLNESL